jgi:hypothetical protein
MCIMSQDTSVHQESTEFLRTPFMRRSQDAPCTDFKLSIARYIAQALTFESGETLRITFGRCSTARFHPARADALRNSAASGSDLLAEKTP